MRLAAAASSNLILSFQASAHARWFLVGEAIRPAPEVVLDGFYEAMIACVLGFVAAAVLVERLAGRHAVLGRLLDAPLRGPSRLAWRLLAVAFGLMLVADSAARVLIAPNLPAGHSAWFDAVLFAQVLVGALFVGQSRLIPAGLAVLALPFACWGLYSFGAAIDYAFELAGIGIAFCLMAPALSLSDLGLLERMVRKRPFEMRLPAWASRASPRGGPARLTGSLDPCAMDAESIANRERQAVSILRVALGLQLMVLSAHDKLIEPAVSLAFVDKYGFVNLPAMLGVPGFTNLHFVIGAGLFELALGLMLVCGIVTRATGGMLLAIFAATGAAFGPEELVGHLPIAAALLVLIAIGSGKTSRRPAPDRWRSGSFLVAAAAAASIVVGAFVAHHPHGSHLADVAAALRRG